MLQRSTFVISLVTGLSLSATIAEQPQDPYETYIRTSRDFEVVKQDKDWCLEAWPSWTYMPWSYKWNIGYDRQSGQWSLANGYNGAFIDHGRTRVNGQDKLAWINQFKLRFYMDHTAGKGWLHLWDGKDYMENRDAIHGTGMRVRPVNEAMRTKLQSLMRDYIGNVKSSPYRAAYALDDEISWGHFVKACMWQITDEPDAYQKWLEEIYGKGNAPKRETWYGYNDLRQTLREWSIRDFDASMLMDQWTFNDAYWCNFVGDLVEYSNRIDPATPCGFVGGQSPNAFGGFDYARLMRKIQFIEAYNIGGSQAVIRSFNPRNALPTVTTHFHKSVDDTIWQVWYYLAHGNRGMIGWVSGWFDGQKPKPWTAKVAPTYLEANRTIGPLMSGVEWIHDGVAIYYNHSSIQLSWILDAEAHGSSWRNRNGDSRLGSSHLVRKAWENMLRDEGIQYTFVNYIDVIREGVPEEYKVLILPATLCLSEAEAKRIREFAENGGTVIADYLPGLWDQHGRGRPDGGVLDDVFGVRHDSSMRAGDIFQSRLWVEVDQDTHYSTSKKSGWKAFLSEKNDCVKDPSGFYKAVRDMDTVHTRDVGKGQAVLMNLSPQWYNAYRNMGVEKAAEARGVFMKHVKSAGIEPWVRIADSGQAEHGYEITYWKKGDRTILFVCMNPEVRGTSLGGGNAAGLKTDTVDITLRFDTPIRGVRDERADKDLPDGREFSFEWTMNEAVVLSFETEVSK